MADTLWNSFHPLIKEWFLSQMGEPTDVQRQAWPAIHDGKHTLIAAPTGSGKTLAALLPCLDRLIQTSLNAPALEKGVRILYVTPLKALNNDIHHHIIHFIGELKQWAVKRQVDWPDITVGVRTGDTAQSTRASMLRRPPEILVTTPESLYLMLTSKKGREILRTVEQVIVDEIHDLAADKRGLHLSVTLERLVSWCGRSPQRIGVSATQKPIERMAQFLGGWEPTEGEDSEFTDRLELSEKDDRIANEQQVKSEYTERLEPSEKEDQIANRQQIKCEDRELTERLEPDEELQSGEETERIGADYVPRAVTIIESPMDRQLQLNVTMAERVGVGRGEERIWRPILEKLAALMEGCTTVLIFTNSRRLCERLTLRLNDFFGGEIARSHHGSVSREQRLDVEQMLKAGELRCIVATSSLELGIDVGHIDLVVQIDSPKSAAAAIQRFGRAGHAVGGVSRGTLLARSRGELAEAAVLARATAARDIEAIRVPRHSLDVLSQQIVAMAATDDWELGRLAAVLARSDGYRGLPRARLLAALDVLGGLFPFARPLIEWNREAKRLSSRPGTPMAAIMGAGTIPPSTGYPVHHAESRLHVGELDEEYIHESRVGDVFQLGASSWTIQSIRPDRIYVTEAANRFSEIPFWRAQPISRSYELGLKVGDFLAELAARELSNEAEARTAERWLKESCFMDDTSAAALVSYVNAQMTVCAVPTSKRIVIEHYLDDGNRHHLVIHSLLGRKFNRTWQLALQLELEKVVPFRIYSSVRDNGIEFVFDEWDPSWLQAVSRVDANQVENLLLNALPSSPLFGIHFRRIAEVSLLLTRGFTRIPSWKRRMRGDDLLRAALPYAEHFPYIREALQEAMMDSLSVPEVKERLAAVARGEIVVVVINTRFPSPFASEFMLDYVAENIYESDAIGRDLQAQVMGVSRTLAEELFGADLMRQAISPDVVRQEKERLENAGGLAKSSEDVYRLLKERGDLSRLEVVKLLGENAAQLLMELQRDRRVQTIAIAGEERFICSDELEFYRGFPKVPLSIDFVLQRFIEHRIAFTPDELSSRYALPIEQSREIIAKWREKKQLEHAPFAESGDEELWTASKVATRIIRFSLQEFRKQAEPIPATRYAGFLADQLGLSASPLSASMIEGGSDRLLQVLAKLEGIFLPRSHWESFILPARISGYRTTDMDLLCSSGEVHWVGKREDGEKEGRIAFFLADSKELYAPFMNKTNPTRHPELLTLLQQKGASFLSVLSREMNQLPSEILDKLLDLVWEGNAANDQFAPLRLQSAAIARKNVKGGKFQSGLGRWYAVTSQVDQAGIAGASLKRTNQIEDPAAAAWVKHLLARFSIVTRDIASSYCPYSWDDLYEILKRLEDWGMLTRGYFVAGISAMQYAEKATIERMRATQIFMGASENLLLCAADPANPFGSILPWPEHSLAAFSRKSSHYLLLSKGEWELWLENGGKRIIEMGNDNPRGRSSSAELSDRPEIVGEDELKVALRSLLQWGKLKKIQVEQWNGVRTSDSHVAPLLERLGAERDRDAYVFWPSSFRSF